MTCSKAVVSSTKIASGVDMCRSSGGFVRSGSASAMTGGGGGQEGAKVERRGGAERGNFAADMFTAGAYISAHLIVGCGGSGVAGKLQPSAVDDERHGIAMGLKQIVMGDWKSVPTVFEIHQNRA